MRSALPLVLALVLGVVSAACDTGGPPSEGGSGGGETATAPLRAFSELAVTGDPSFSVGLGTSGEIRATSEANDTFWPYSSGLWLGSEANGTSVSAVWLAAFPLGNYSAACGGSNRLFALDADTLYTGTEIWPRELGAPVRADGSPRVYGDRMLWGSFCAASSPNNHPAMAAPVQDIRLNTAVYGYDRADLAGVRLVRFEVTNTGSAAVPDLRIGHYSDTDSPGALSDAVGYDTEAGMSYVYNLGSDATTGERFTTAVSGFAFLRTPADTPVYTHRIMRKSTFVDPAFGEGVERPDQLLYALKGLSNDGDPMADPTTGQPSLFAFTGNPFAGTGWRDGLAADGSYRGADVRHMTALAPVSIGPGQSRVATVAWVTADAGDSAASLANVRSTLAAVRAEPSLWQF